MKRALISITLRQWRMHKLRTGLTILSISLGVAVFFAVLTANITLLGSLKTTVDKMAGKSTLQVTAGEIGFPESVLDTVRETPGVKIAEPVIEVIANTASKDEGALMVIGVDSTGEQKLHEYEFDEKDTDITDQLVYLAQPDSILVSRKFMDEHNLKTEDKLALFTSQGRKEFTIRGVFKPKGIGEVFDGRVAVMDIYSAQFIFNRGRSFDRIDIMTEPNVPVDTVAAAIRAKLASGVEVDRPAARGKSIDNSVSAMTLGMNITSYIALLVGVFIIFNSFTIAVNQRWKEIGVLRALGVERGNIARMFLLEAILMGILGALIGIGMGFYLANGASKFMTAIATQLYAHVSTTIPPIFRWDYALAAFLIGIASSLLAAWLPARAASQLNPVLALHNIEVRNNESMVGWARTALGIVLIVAGLLLIRFATFAVGMMIQFSYSFIMLVGLILILPKFSAFVAALLRPVMDRCFGSEGVLAVDTMIKSPKRTSATVGALMIGLMFVFSTGAYVRSFKDSVVGTFDRTINSDYFISTSEQARSRSYHFSEDLSKQIGKLPEVKRIENVRFTFIPYQNDTIALIAIDMEGWFARAVDPIIEGDKAKARELVTKGDGFLISDNFAKRFSVGVGDKLKVETPKGPLERPIMGIIDDYTSEKGSFFLDRELYKQYWQDTAVDFIEVNVKPNVDQAAFKRQLKQIVANEHRAFIYTNQEYRAHVLGLIDGFFLLNYMQMVIAIFVAAIGIFNTLVISVSERRREIGILRAIGGLRGQIGRMVLLEAVAMAITGLIIGVFAGMLNTYFLVRTAAMIIGGFHLTFNVPVSLILVTLPIIIVVALIAAWWPASKAVNLKVVEAIGYE